MPFKHFIINSNRLYGSVKKNATTLMGNCILTYDSLIVACNWSERPIFHYKFCKGKDKDIFEICIFASAV